MTLLHGFADLRFWSCSTFEDVPLVEFTDVGLVFPRMPGESYRRRLGSALPLLYLCYVYRALINSLVRPLSLALSFCQFDNCRSCHFFLSFFLQFLLLLLFFFFFFSGGDLKGWGVKGCDQGAENRCDFSCSWEVFCVVKHLSGILLPASSRCWRTLFSCLFVCCCLFVSLLLFHWWLVWLLKFLSVCSLAALTRHMAIAATPPAARARRRRAAHGTQWWHTLWLHTHTH